MKYNDKEQKRADRDFDRLLERLLTEAKENQDETVGEATPGQGAGDADRPA